MRAAIVDHLNEPPRYGAFAEPVASQGELLIHVEAAAITQLVRAIASGKHYSSKTPPFVPGFDGVGITASGERVYFAFPTAPFGAMSERTIANARYTIRVPAGLDPVMAAAIANPGMSSWVALTRRASLRPGETVLIIGANGTSGRLAIQIAKHLGAGRVVAAARQASSEPELLALGADSFMTLTGDLRDAFAREMAMGIDVVLDYVWGPPAEAFFAAATGTGGPAAAPRIRFVNIGGLAGPSVTLPAAAIRSSGLEIFGSGLGSVSHTVLIESVGELFAAVAPASLTVETVVRPLSEVSVAWQEDTRARMVLTMAIERVQ